ncbi:MAG: glycosyl transferase family 1, partial [Nitrolancea sp.]
MYELIRGVRRSSDVEILSLTDDATDLHMTEKELGRVTAVTVPFTARSATTRARRTLQLRSIASTRSAQNRLYIHAECQRVLDRLTAASGFDLVQFEFSQMGGYGVRSALPTVIDVHN